jgi:hypothetical protein
VNLIQEGFKIDQGLVTPDVLLSPGNVTGPFYPMKDYTRALAVLQVGAMVLATQCKLEIYEGAGIAGAGAAPITDADVTIVANMKVSAVTITLDTVTTGLTVTINSLIFTSNTSTTTLATRTFSIATSDTASGDELVKCINSTLYGVPGVLASNDAGTVTLVADPSGEVTITAASASGTMEVATLSALAVCEIQNEDLTLDSIACKVTNTNTGGVSVLLLRQPRGSAIQQVADAASV